jgi:(4-O-methyl)-D-glucuronate---lignin esterase
MLPDPLVLANEQPVRDAKTWFEKRRPEILKYYEEDIYGRIPATAPKVTFEVTVVDKTYFKDTAILKQIIMHIGPKGGPNVKLSLIIPTRSRPPPAVVAINSDSGADDDQAAQFLRHGYAFISLHSADIQGNNWNSFRTGVQQLGLAPGQPKLEPYEWGTIACWAWGASRVMDYLQADADVDRRHVAVWGKSVQGKTALLAGATDQRFALVFACCGGVMGSALSRRDYGETIDDLIQNYPWEFAANFQKYAGHWNQLPVDAHLLISLCAPRPVLITAGVEDQWDDPRGEFLAEVAAGPVYRLLGARDLGTITMPKPDEPLLTGDLAFHYHHEGLTVPPTDWAAFFEFADRYLKPAAPGKN